jgi:hypothetical protein
MISVSAGYGTDGSSTPTTVAGRGPETDYPANHGRIALERSGPEPVGQDRDTCRLRPIVPGIQQTAEYGAKAHHVENDPADNPRLDGSRFAAESDQREVNRRKIPERADACDLRLEIVYFGTEKVMFAVARPGALWRM